MGGLVSARKIESKELRDELTIALLEMYPSAVSETNALAYEMIDNSGEYHLVLSSILRLGIEKLICDIHGKFLSGQDLSKLMDELYMKAGTKQCITQ